MADGRFLLAVRKLRANPVARVLLRGAVVYLAGVAIVRIASKRLMGSHTPFDFLAVILGSMLARAVNGGAPLLGTLAACGPRSGEPQGHGLSG